MTKQESIQLQIMADNQQQFKEAIEKVLTRLDEQDKALAQVNKTLDELTGGKKALMWVTGILISVAALSLAFWRELHS